MLLPDSHWYNTTPACDRQTQGDSKYRASIALREKNTAFSVQHLRPSGVFICWPDGMEHSLGFYSGSIELQSVSGVS